MTLAFKRYIWLSRMEGKGSHYRSGTCSQVLGSPSLSALLFLRLSTPPKAADAGVLLVVTLSTVMEKAL